MWWIIKGLLFIYLSVVTIKDIKTQTVPIKWTILFGVLAIILHIVSWENPAVWLAGILPGLCLLSMARVTSQSVGYGDGYVLLVIGLYLGITASILILITGLLVMCPVALVLLIWKKNRKKTLPFVPFLFMAYILWLMI